MATSILSVDKTCQGHSEDENPTHLAISSSHRSDDPSWFLRPAFGAAAAAAAAIARTKDKINRDRCGVKSRRLCLPLEEQPEIHEVPGEVALRLSQCI